MKFLIILIALLLFANCSQKQLIKQKEEAESLLPQELAIDTFKVEIVDQRWLEDSKNPRTVAWTEKQNQRTFSWLHSDTIIWNNIYERLIKLSRRTEWYHPRKVGNKEDGFFYLIYRRQPEEQQFSLLKFKDFNAEPEIVIDTRKFRKDNTAAISHIDVASNGKYMIYGISYDGSDELEIRVKNLYTNEDLPDLIPGLKYISTAWVNNKGFYYSGIKTEDSTSLDKLYFHKLGDDIKNDEIIYQVKKKGVSIACTIPKNQKFLFVFFNQGTNPENKVWYRKLSDNTDWIKLVDDYDYSYDLVKVSGNIAYFLTDEQAPKKKLVSVNLTKPDAWQVVIPESEDLIDDIDFINYQFVISYLSNACNQIKLFNMNGVYLEDIELPTTGTVYGIGGRKEDTEMFIGFTSYSYPFSTLKYDFTNKTYTVFKTELDDFDADKFSVKQIFYESLDGTQIPMFIVSKKGIKIDGQRPTILYGYGGFNISMTPWFSTFITEWVDRGGIYVVANLRGGGEYGQPWHKAGMLDKKQYVFDDFIAAAKYLYQQNYTNPAKLAIMGGSNGGLLVAACMTQRPDLFGAVVCQVPVIDMVRFKNLGAGMYWVGEYGDIDNPSQFGFMYRYDPLINIRRLIYPPTLITTADTDNRVDPAHAKKFGYELQKNQIGGNPILIRIETAAGHGYGKGKDKTVSENTDIMTFLLKTIGK